MIDAFVLIIGILIGSFLNVCIYRIPKKETIVAGRSHCMSCMKEIKWYDLVPVISYLILGGKCRYCKEKLSLQYPCIELMNGLAYFVLYRVFEFQILFFISCVVFSVAIVFIMIQLNKRKDTMNRVRTEDKNE